MSSGDRRPQRFTDGGIVEVTAWITVGVASLAVVTKVVSKCVLARKLQLDDICMVTSLVLAIGYGIALHLAVLAGLGESMSKMNQVQQDTFEKTKYASDLLYIISLALTKCAPLVFFRTVASNSTYGFAINALLAFIMAATLTSTLVVAFECGLPQPWELLSGTCLDKAAFWAFFAAFDILTDISLVILSISLLQSLRISAQRRFRAMLAFGIRILTTPVIVARVVYLSKNQGVIDKPRADFAMFMATSVHIGLSIITTCIPFMKATLRNLSSGFLDVSEEESRKENGYSLQAASASRPNEDLSKYSIEDLPEPRGASQQQKRLSGESHTSLISKNSSATAAKSLVRPSDESETRLSSITSM